MSLGEVPERMVDPEAIEPSTSGNHDNPVSGNHQASPSKVLEERRACEQGGRGTKTPNLPSTIPAPHI